MALREIAAIKKQGSSSIAEGMSNVDVEPQFEHAMVHGAKTFGSAGRLSWLSKQLFGNNPAPYSKMTRSTTVSFPGEEENTAQLPQSARGGM